MKTTTDAKTEKALSYILKVADTAKLLVLLENARNQGAEEVVAAVLQRLKDLNAAASAHPVVALFWACVDATEKAQGTRCQRVRNSVKNRMAKGQTEYEVAMFYFEKWPRESETKGFETLMKLGRTDCTAEMFVSKNPEYFSPGAVKAAQNRLADMMR